MATVLLIDDDAHIRAFVERLLRSAGYEVISAGDGKAGLEALRLHNPDLVITDIIMPKQEGIETITRIREASQVPIIAISGSIVTENFDPLRDAGALGADVTIAKPFRGADLLAAVAKLLAP